MIKDLDHKALMTGDSGESRQLVCSPMTPTNQYQGEGSAQVAGQQRDGANQSYPKTEAPIHNEVAYFDETQTNEYEMNQMMKDYR